ncbi:MAG: hypothetical protein A2087_01800 [Spirochaetes bacterium GWD1_61_31]|nr:MAG: hypothetical protein A2Y37_10165 [Spirochaetes bacterium GWB1_60_80]OHD29053.1 MAG: hypothetical protein A2004_14475 [Spirochaetes bacterium GWC1_61_12]OHD35913.1 MAG: hypothetical protein A2087_01800 [Spirochaetes bacterium GWD1_61_31]OHD44220.1 MAG: hypothetical protein A2Y35_06680 [Spirochaetes bacterium GWE1_60_18]OHD60420.1 MAG: hypothetical protein A2Y32_00845 [Spirochaetes bacterium GWF1_60_12]HAP43261.1 Sua5/YciO/YrdC/YwlC family protein [Spirochaetaceae bacterium]
MTEYIVTANPDQRVLQRAARGLAEGWLVAIPTDTSWSIACSIHARGGIDRLKKLVRPGAVRPLTVLCASINQAAELCDIGDAAFRVMKRLVPGPYVFVLPSTNRCAKDFELKRAEIGLRIPRHAVVLGLVEALGSPLLSLTAKRSMLPDAEAEADAAFPEDQLFSAGWELEDIPGVDLVLDPGEENGRELSTVLDLRAGDVQVLRAGAGVYP